MYVIAMDIRRKSYRRVNTKIALLFLDLGWQKITLLFLVEGRGQT